MYNQLSNDHLKSNTGLDLDKLVLGVTKDTKKHYLTYVKGTTKSKLGCSLELHIIEEKKVAKGPICGKRIQK